jgi:hypothetical protein
MAKYGVAQRVLLTELRPCSIVVRPEAKREPLKVHDPLLARLSKFPRKRFDRRGSVGMNGDESVRPG